MYNTLGPVLCLCFFIITGATKFNIKRVSVDIGKNVTIQCPLHKTKDVMWEREGRTADENIKMNVLENGSLFLQEVDRNDSAIYSCVRENDVKDIRGRVNVTVKTPPPPLIVSIKPSTILALILWEVKGTGGYPIVNFTAQYRLAYSNTSWIPISPNHITPNSRQVEVYNLIPNTTYEFRIWATNQLGKSPIVNVFGTTRNHYPERVGRFLLRSFRDLQAHKRVTFQPALVFYVETRNEAAKHLSAFIDTNTPPKASPASLLFPSIFLVFSLNFLFFFTKELARHLLEGADKFDTRWWAVAVGIVMGTLVLLGIGTCTLLYQECKTPTVEEEQEVIELVPNIILNPGFEGAAANRNEPDENSNNENPMRLNNNTVVQPRNV